MKEPAFFIKKAKEYVSEMEAVISNNESFQKLSTLQYSDKDKQKSALELNIRLLFAEFDNGSYFVDEMKKINDNWMRYEPFETGSMLAEIELLNLFISHIKEFRTESTWG
jgi:hypothetical protein